MRTFARPMLHVAATLLPLTLGAAGCSRLVAVDLTLAEPCGQENQALNGVSSFRIVSSGAEPDGVVAFTSDQPQTLQMGLGDKVVITVEAYADDITAGGDPTAPSVLPKAAGATMPLAIGAETDAVKGVVLIGKVDSFGAPRGAGGSCTAMTNGAAVPGRHGHTATYLPKVNKVLLFGGAVWTPDGAEAFLKSAEVYDPATGTFSALPAPANARAYHTATALPDGRVLILGGFSVLNGTTAPLGSGLLVDVNADNTYVKVIRMRVPRAHHTATLLDDVGLVGIIGGCTGYSLADGCAPDRASGGSTTALTPSVEYVNVEDVGDETLAAAGNLSGGRAMHTAVAFPGGAAGFIAVAGGLNGVGALDTLELVPLAGGSFGDGLVTTGRLPEPLVRHQMVVVGDKTIALTGGQTQASNGILNPAAPASAKATVCDLTLGAGTCNQWADMTSTRFGHAMARLRDGSLLVVGGVSPAGATAEVLRVVPEASAPTWVPTAGPLAVARDRAAFALLGGDDSLDGFVNQVLYSGGHSTVAPYVTSSLTDIYFGSLSFGR
ncbi:MAG: hypothetical protein FJ137_03105 [Deltaproteobacteria bacterium]|nr:hypothetical protein [Deltaproteobacteria bacterium]